LLSGVFREPDAQLSFAVGVGMRRPSLARDARECRTGPTLPMLPPLLLP
jgi:hypothetical protein